MDWTRLEVKDRAKEFLKKHYWKAFIVCLILVLINSIITTAGGQIGDNPSFEFNSKQGLSYQSGLSKVSLNILLLVFSILLILFSTIMPLLNVGKYRFFIKGLRDDEDVRIDHIISTFTWDEAWPIIKTHIIRNIRIILWTLLFIVPGIIKSYEYYFVDYIMAENPTMHHKDVFELSRKMTYGHKLDIFMLRFSFIGWELLGLLALGVGILFVTPYKEASYAALYEKLSDGYQILPEDKKEESKANQQMYN